ncbi:hypothetical protein FIBSPDRAFT_702711, partial [Athelia psychrophila]
WSRHATTQAAQKVPKNWESQCDDTFLRVVCRVRMRDIPQEAILNGDQTGLVITPVSKKTWAPTSAKQVEGFGKEEKRQFTLMITTMASGDMLPIQSIWSGKTEQSLPSAS